MENFKGSYGIINFDINLEEIDPFDPITIKRIRTYFDVTQKEFAKMLDVSPRAIEGWERRKRDYQSRDCKGPARKLIMLLVELKQKKDRDV